MMCEVGVGDFWAVWQGKVRYWRSWGESSDEGIQSSGIISFIVRIVLGLYRWVTRRMGLQFYFLCQIPLSFEHFSNFMGLLKKFSACKDFDCFSAGLLGKAR